MLVRRRDVSGLLGAVGACCCNRLVILPERVLARRQKSRKMAMGIGNEMGYAVVRGAAGDFAQVVEQTRQALTEQGFGIMSEIDVAAALKKRLGVDYPRTIILGACNPTLAHKALQAAVDVSVLMPCNVVVRENNQGKVEVAAIDTMAMAHLINHPQFDAIAEEVGHLLSQALAKIP
ncbi:MAG: DUF302 domain-containing protein [Magnetococcales bacterium]|nr:DUF302 domain-containing protein [Magnetococcales bacterium]MBF0322715.1 DUF302 domain-containing protein [Magnetococcales bacterium]